MKTNRRTLLMGAAALGLAAPFIRPGAARAAEFTYKLANNQPMTVLRGRSSSVLARGSMPGETRVGVSGSPSCRGKGQA